MGAIRFRGSGWNRTVPAAELPALVERLRLSANAWGLAAKIESRSGSANTLTRDLPLAKSERRALLFCLRTMLASERVSVSAPLRELAHELEDDLAGYEG